MGRTGALFNDFTIALMDLLDREDENIAAAIQDDVFHIEEESFTMSEALKGYLATDYRISWQARQNLYIVGEIILTNFVRILQHICSAPPEKIKLEEKGSEAIFRLEH